MRWETGEPTVSERKLPRARRHPPVTPSSRFLIDEHRDIQGDLKFGICPLLFFIILSGNIYVGENIFSFQVHRNIINRSWIFMCLWKMQKCAECM